MRFCSDYGIAILVLEWDRSLMSVVACPAARTENIIRAQVNSDSLRIARELIKAKVNSHCQVGALDRNAAAKWIGRIINATDISSLTLIEAQAARQAWFSRATAIKWREAGKLPPSWKHPWGIRRAIGRRGSSSSAYKATDPINAMLNLALAVTAGRLTVALAAYGLSPAIGFLHKSPRWPLTYDAIEPLRPYVESSVFDFVETNPMTPKDFFVENGTGAVKTRPRLHKVFVDATALPQSKIDGAADFVGRLLAL
jgi:CRISPR-associated endonuclease Cas1